MNHICAAQTKGTNRKSNRYLYANVIIRFEETTIHGRKKHEGKKNDECIRVAIIELLMQKSRKEGAGTGWEQKDGRSL